MTRVDWIALAVVGVAALFGFRKGLVASALSVVGIVAGAVLGARIAPHLLAGTDSPFTPLAALIGAAVGAVVLEMVGLRWMRSRLLRTLVLDVLSLLACGLAAMRHARFVGFTIRTAASLPVPLFQRLNTMRNALKNLGGIAFVIVNDSSAGMNSLRDGAVIEDRIMVLSGADSASDPPRSNSR